MAIDHDIIRINRREQSWVAEFLILRAIMEGTVGTNPQRNTLRRMIRQHAAVLNQAQPAQVHAALRKVGELARIPNITGDTQPKIALGNFINQRNPRT